MKTRPQTVARIGPSIQRVHHGSNVKHRIASTGGIIAQPNIALCGGREFWPWDFIGYLPCWRGLHVKHNQAKSNEEKNPMKATMLESVSAGSDESYGTSGSGVSPPIKRRFITRPFKAILVVSKFRAHVLARFDSHFGSERISQFN